VEYRIDQDGQQRIMNHLADCVFELSDAEILAEVRETQVDPQEEADRMSLVLLQASKAFDDVNNCVSTLGHSINSHDWRSEHGSYYNNCLNCGSSVSFTAATGEIRGDALRKSCPENAYPIKRREVSR
jgi:hypothetical protein